MEEQTPFGKPDYEIPSYLEKVQSQLPALHLLMQMGWQFKGFLFTSDSFPTGLAQAKRSAGPL
ncbi:MAG: hypothetical protein U9N83_11920 [Thermodesulfobacteriota bacterium]|nr:hypothetical protein [Thermodesulfobacteriota bacterium]